MARQYLHLVASTLYISRCGWDIDYRILDVRDLIPQPTHTDAFTFSSEVRGSGSQRCALYSASFQVLGPNVANPQLFIPDFLMEC